ncbi:MAG TPA: 3-hydroxyacyl-CoA dehydrogenase NAD-binding domain-containing protein, partial [Steroidobacteraceae bacterium]|nr:3-hydroxyacyl-CoA dehydrogenase NAD-binding domain-containing protein [Steroidobacteraceae bacterium]
LLDGAVKFAERIAASGQRHVLVRDRDSKIAAARGNTEVFDKIRQSGGRRWRGQMAPGHILKALEGAVNLPFDEGIKLERQLATELIASDQSKAQRYFFFAEREAAKIPGLSPDIKPIEVRKGAIIGAGTMGGGIAMNFANAGIPVRVLEVSPQALERGLAVIASNYGASVKRGSLTPQRAERALSLIRGVSDYGDLDEADIIIEAVFEDMNVKQEVFVRLDRVAARDAILATNTSTLDIDAIASVTARPDKVVGTHFFSPANVMRLLENVRGARSSPQTLATVMALGKTLGKVTVLAGNCDGFIGNRMVMYYGSEAEFLLEEGATPEQLDRVMEGFGFAMGPLAMRDLAGNDVGFLIRKRRKLPADERFSTILERLVAQGRLGQKAGRGFYRYDGRTRLPDPEVLALIEGVSRDLRIRRRQIPDEEILDRLLHPLVNEGAKIVDEGIALRAGDIDVVYVNGYGFPAWRGGPMYWAEQAGLKRVVETMQRLAPTHGARWRPAPLLARLAASGQGWASVEGPKSR